MALVHFWIRDEEDPDLIRLGDEMEPWLRSCGISFDRCADSMPVHRQDTGQYILRLSLTRGKGSGEIRFAPTNADAVSAADSIAQYLRRMPEGKKLRLCRDGSCEEGIVLALPESDMNVPLWGEALGRALAEFFSLPCLMPGMVTVGTADLAGGMLCIRTGPSPVFPVVVQVPDGCQLQVYNRFRSWFVVEWQGISGYAPQDGITLRSDFGMERSS